ncbi:FAD-dependent monooxygenase [Streptomyces sp. WMMC500]|uniref:FAD-dependent monooxygenase n=1 Tax=Streptomyces sp. WMMC500 TaxID=3015154 RepID=UPI00248D3A00|nr:FAD-dependent monooxygenase [Streptomyces sp. WMMC500]WBB62175.1 FAD-dependent monooxygenase [Streptomyces sp. WMMC500]
MTRTPRVAVAGAGLGGLAAAAALVRQGLEVAVYEQRPRLPEDETALHLAPNGSRILQRWGLGAELLELAVQPVALEFREWSDGTLTWRQPLGRMGPGAFAAPYCTLLTDELYDLLLARLPQERIRLGRRLSGFTGRADGVELEFADGGTATADVLVGADGVRSLVRSRLIGTPRRVYHGTTAYSGAVQADEVPELARDRVTVWLGPESRMVGAPVAQGEQFGFVAVAPSRSRTARQRPASGRPTALAADFGGWAPDVKAIAAAAGGVQSWTPYDHAPLKRWGSGRVTLLGDAAHPMLPYHGQGVSQCLEDAVALAHHLARAPDPTLALRRYEALRLPHTARVQLGSRANAFRPAAAPDITWAQVYDIGEHLPG